MAAAELTAAHTGTPAHDTGNDSFSATLRCHDANGELYNVTFSRDRITIYQVLRPSIPCMKTALTILFIIAFALACGCTTKAPPATQAAGVPAPSPAAAPSVPQATAGGTTLPAPSPPANVTPAGTVTWALRPMVTLIDHHGPTCAEMRLMPGAGCCGVATVYLINESICCGGKLYMNATTSCCGGSRLFNYSTDGCCNSTVYDLHKEHCCNYRVVTGNCTGGNGSISR